MILGIPLPYIIFLLLGVALTLTGVIIQIVACIRCTEEVNAVCISINSYTRRIKRRRVEVRNPIWQFVYEGRYYRVEDQSASNMVSYRIGDECVLYINPDKPEQFRRKGSLDCLAVIIIGMIWTAMVVGMILFERLF